MTLDAGRPATPARRAESSQAAGSAWSLAIALLVLAADQGSKAAAEGSLSARPESGPSILGGWLSLTYTTNSGAAFGFLAGRDGFFLLAGLIVVALLLMAWRVLAAGRLLPRLSLGLLLGGAAGNLLDRARLGSVRDFIHLRYWPVFNLADSAIVAGMCLLLYYLLLDKQQRPEQNT